jgi:dienelactone hydrolase
MSTHAACQEFVRVEVNGGIIEGDLEIPAGADSLVIFAHGSGSSRQSPRNRFVAHSLNEAGHATLLIDLLTPKEDHLDSITGELRFDIDLLATRLTAASDWAATHDETRDLIVGYFGASTGAAAALVDAAQRKDVAAVVSRGGRPDLAGSAISKVRAPTLLIVGGADYGVIQLNEVAYDDLVQSRHKELKVVHGATHLFEETGALEEVARLAADWFSRFLRPQG